MTFADFLPQLQTARGQLAQLNEPFPATMGVITHPGGGTAHEHQGQTALTPAGALFRRLLTRVSHTGAMEASPAAAAQQAAVVPLGHAAPGPGAAADDLVLRG